MADAAVIEAHRQPWRPLSPREVMAVFSRAAFPWWIAGGHAIEHFADRRLRRHGDIDVLLLRKEQGSVRELLAAWDCWAADPPGRLRPWRHEEVLPPSVTDVWCRETGGCRWRFQLMLDDGDDCCWWSRRCSSVRKRVSELTVCDAHGVRYLTPEVQLFYKAQAPRPKDDVDLAAALPLLSESQRAWLRDAIATAYGRKNAWLVKIAERC